MNSLIPLFAAIDLPDKFKAGIGYGMIAVIGCSTIYCFIKCIQGANQLDEGGEGKKKIFSGIAMGVAPWLMVGAFKAAKLDTKLGLDSMMSSLPKLDPEIVDVMSLAIWSIIGVAAVWCTVKCIQGAQMLEHGENGKGKIVSGIAIGLAPWIAVAAMKLSSFSDAIGFSLTGTP